MRGRIVIGGGSRRPRGLVVAVVAVVAAGAVATAGGLAPAAGAQTVTVAPRSGGWYGSASTSTQAGGIFQDVALNTSPGQLVCGSAWLRTDYPATGASGQFALWLVGGSATDGASRSYSGLSNLGNWTQAHTCVEATGSHTSLRIQFYPAPGSPAVDMDDVDVHESLAVNGGFENGSGPWAPYPGTSTNYQIYAPAPGAADPAYSGSHFAATNTGSSGGGIYQDVALNTTAGQLVCGSAQLRTEGGTGASGQFNLWLISGSTSDGGSVSYAGLGNDANWTAVHTCVEATGPRSTLRIQLYPAPGSPTVEIDDVDVETSLGVNGGFEDGPGPWAPYPQTASNYTDYPATAGAPARSGAHFGATNTASDGGGIYQDISLATAPGQIVCGSAWLRNEGGATGATGLFDLWLIGGGSGDGGSVSYSGLGPGWTQAQTCVEATAARSILRVQVYPAPGSPTVEVDDVEAHLSLAGNGGFEYGTAPWAIWPGTASSFDVHPTSQATVPPPPPAAPVVSDPTPTPLPTPHGRHALRVRLSLFWTWRYGTTWLRSARIGRFPHDTRLTVLCRGRGCPRPVRLRAGGPGRIHRLLARLRGRRFQRGDVLRITLSARGYRTERAQVVFRYGRLPLARLVGR